MNQSGTLFHALAYLFVVQHYGHIDPDKTKPFDGARYRETWCVGKIPKKYITRSQWIAALLEAPPPISQLSHLRFATCLWHTDKPVNQNGEGDHVHPRSKGGYETAWYLCPSCQSSKGAKNLFEWMQRKELAPPTNGLIECLRINHVGPICLEHAFNELLWLTTKLDYQYSTKDALRAPAPSYYGYIARALRKSYLPSADWHALSEMIKGLQCP